jgi:hypothetical protein
MSEHSKPTKNNKDTELESFPIVKCTGQEGEESATTSEKDRFAIYDTYRKIVIHEDGLINWRVTWLIIFQGILISAFVQAGLSANTFPDTIPAVELGLELIGLLHSVLSFFGILSASLAIRTLRIHYEENHKFRNLPPLTGGGKRNVTTNLGVAYHLLLPLIFLLTWTYLLFAF